MKVTRLRKIISRKGYFKRQYHYYTSLAERWRYLSWKGVKDADKMMNHYYLKAAWYLKKINEQ